MRLLHFVAKDIQDRFRGCLLGLAAGDAVGTTVEFQARGSFTPVTDMTGGGPFRLAPGEWTDDTSMALCLATSLIKCQGFDAADQMERYTRWLDEGYMSSNGRCFDIGNTTSEALDRFQASGEPLAGPTHERSAGNGSIMRLAPVPLFFYPDREATLEHAALSSKTTHGAAECVDACRLLADIILRALAGSPMRSILVGDRWPVMHSDSILAIAGGAYDQKTEADIRGSGYVVESLEAALWCFSRTESFSEAILKAANLGADADTTAAVCGQVAGAYYGASAIPPHWLDRLALRARIEDLADQLLHTGGPA